MTTARTNPMHLVDYVNELTRIHHHREPYAARENGAWVPHTHATEVDALLDQLIANDTPSAAADEGPRPGFASKPAARLEAIDVAIRIDLEAARWVRDLGHDDHHTNTAATVRQLHGLAASADPEQRREIERDVRRWWIAARIITGWDTAAWTPDNTCPACNQRGTLRVRLADHIGMCTNDACRTIWDTATIGLLADHIRFESEAEKAPRVPPPACSPLPSYAALDLAYMCPACGSARCVRAVGARMAAVRAAS